MALLDYLGYNGGGIQQNPFGGGGQLGGNSDPFSGGAGGDDDELQRAIQASLGQNRVGQSNQLDADYDEDLQRILEMSRNQK